MLKNEEDKLFKNEWKVEYFLIDKSGRNMAPEEKKPFAKHLSISLYKSLNKFFAECYDIHTIKKYYGELIFSDGKIVCMY